MKDTSDGHTAYLCKEYKTTMHLCSGFDSKAFYLFMVFLTMLKYLRLQILLSSDRMISE
jgi:hypothetical protein